MGAKAMGARVRRMEDPAPPDRPRGLHGRHTPAGNARGGVRPLGPCACADPWRRRLRGRSDAGRLQGSDDRRPAGRSPVGPGSVPGPPSGDHAAFPATSAGGRGGVFRRRADRDGARGHALPGPRTRRPRLRSITKPCPPHRIAATRWRTTRNRATRKATTTSAPSSSWVTGDAASVFAGAGARVRGLVMEPPGQPASPSRTGRSSLSPIRCATS